MSLLQTQEEPKIILFDLETMPNLKEAMKVWPGLGNYPGLTLKATINTIICAGWKKLGDRSAKCINAWDFPEWKKDINADKKVCQAIYDVLKDADAVVTQNGKRFDWKFLQTRLIKHGIGPLPKIPHIDTKDEMKRNLYLFNNKLSTAGKFLVDEDKLENGGWDLWVRVSERDKKAQRLMTRYCKQDVNLLEKIFVELRKFSNSIPNYNNFNISYAGGKMACPKCGSTAVKRNGFRYTTTRRYQRYQCNSCHGYFRTDAKDESPRNI